MLNSLRKVELANGNRKTIQGSVRSNVSAMIAILISTLLDKLFDWFAVFGLGCCDYHVDLPFSSDC